MTYLPNTRASLFHSLAFRFELLFGQGKAPGLSLKWPDAGERRSWSWSLCTGTWPSTSNPHPPLRAPSQRLSQGQGRGAGLLTLATSLNQTDGIVDFLNMTDYPMNILMYRASHSHGSKPCKLFGFHYHWGWELPLHSP